MQRIRRYTAVMFVFSLIGVAFSGYLTYSKFILNACVVDPTCPYFLGQPACLTGLILFLVLSLLSIVLMFRLSTKRGRQILAILILVSGLSVLFAGYVSYIDLSDPACQDGECTYLLLLPSCVYGIVMYMVIFLLGIFAYRKLGSVIDQSGE